MEHVSCLILYGYMSYLRQSWSTFTQWGQALIYYWLGLSTHWGLNTHLQQLAFILFFLYYRFSIFLQVFRLACMAHCLALCPTCTRCGILWIGRFTPRLWTIVPLFSNPQNNCLQSVHSLHFTAPFANKLWYYTSASHALLTGKNSGRIIKEKVFFQCSSHKTFRFSWFKNQFLISHQRCFQIRASAFNADLSTV